MTRSRCLIAVAALSLLSGCSIFGGSDRTLSGQGYVVADEPQAAKVGAAVLAHGGNAADAVTAMYLALSVTFPVAAGLGGGGVCVVHAGQRNTTLSFLPRQASHGTLYAVPGNVSGFSRLQSMYGRLPWQRVVSPAESLAAAGFRISPSLEARLSGSADIIRLDAALSAEFLNESGAILPTDTEVRAPALAQTLSQIRTLGPQAFYRGAPAGDIASYSAAQGGEITASDLSGYAPDISDALKIRVGSLNAYLPADSTSAGQYAGAVLSRVVGGQGQVAAGSESANAAISAANAALPAGTATSLPLDFGETGFAAVDNEGMAAACAVTMNGPFGSGHTVGPIAVTLANAPKLDRFGLSGMFLTPLIAASEGQVSLAGSGSGGPEGSAGIILALLQLADGKDIIQPGALHGTGREPLQTVNVIGCQNDICVAVPDPAGRGLGASG